MYKLLLLCICLPCFLLAQPPATYYTNTLRDATGQPIVGATIHNIATHQATVTNAKGFFSIKASVGDVIQISSVGYNINQLTITQRLLEDSPDNSLQPVATIISSDYTALIKNNKTITALTETDSTNNISRSTLRLSSNYYQINNIAGISIKNNKLYINPLYSKRIKLGGTYSSTIEMGKANATPALQNEYAQGRPLNGQLTWQGAETSEPFNFGPAISTLYYDGSSYAYDNNGRLTTTNTSKPAQVYNNSIFRTALLQSHILNFHGSYYNGRDYQPTFYFSLNAGQTSQSTIIQQNKNKDYKWGGAVTTNLKKISISGNFNYQQSSFTNGNRNGFLNRIYQNVLLTPASFSNKQGYMISSGQRSYSNIADNPYFLLNESDNGYTRSQINAGLTIEKKSGNFTYKLLQAFENVSEINNESYKKSSAFFEDGISTQRTQQGRNYSIQAQSTYTFRKDQFTSVASANYILGIANTNIQYTNPFSHYHYQRTAHDAAFNWNTTYNDYTFEAGVNVSDKFYFSNTTASASFFLPAVNGFLHFKNILETALNIKLSSSFNWYKNELPIHQSLAYTNLLQLSTNKAFQYFPRKEVTTYKNLLPIAHTDWNSKVEIDYNHLLSLSAEVFIRSTKQDIFPVYTNDELRLENVANHRSKGIELELSYSSRNNYNRKISWGSNLSFLAYNTIVTNVANGYEYLPTAGFSDVHKALVKNQPLGVIVGSSWLRDKNGNQIISTDGFPLVNTQPQIIGNPIPDFVIKGSNTLSYKRLKLNIDLEWKQGGDIWNGTEAVLDYYGRSANTATLRNTTNYVFNGVMQNGDKNTIPVSFLDPSKPVENSRWTRYGYSGVAEDYIQHGDYLRVHDISLSYKHYFRKIIQTLTLSAYAGNIVLWSAYKGVDPRQALYDSPNGDGLDFFNLPSIKSFGITASVQF